RAKAITHNSDMLACLVAMSLSRPVPFHVDGNHVVDGGSVVTLRGVNIPSLEWSNEGEFVFRSARVAIEDWKATCIRLPMSEERAIRYHTPGFQAILDTIRKSRAKNVCVVGGLDCAYDLSGVSKGNYALQDPGGNGIIYDAHIYPWKTDWEGRVGALSSKAPV